MVLKTLSREPSWKALFAFTTRANSVLLCSAIISAFAKGAVSPASNLLIGYILTGFTDMSSQPYDTSQFLEEETKYVFAMIGITAYSWIFNSLEFTTWLAFGGAQAKNARDQLFGALLQQDVAWFETCDDGPNALLIRYLAQVRELELATAQPLGMLFALIMTSVYSMAQALYISWDLTLVTLASAPIFMALVAFAGKRTQQHLQTQQKHLAQAQKYSSGAISGIETVKSFCAQSLEVKKFTISISDARVAYIRIANANASQMSILVLMTAMMFVQGFYYGNLLVSQGTKSSGDVVTTFLSAVGALGALQAMIPQLIVLEKGRAAGAALKATLSATNGQTPTEKYTGGILPDLCFGNITFRKVFFKYPSSESHLALKNVNLCVGGGQITFIVGRSGSGKSTIGQLLLGFYSPSRGQIQVDGYPLDALNTQWLRSNITLVEQQTTLFNDTIHQNIALGAQSLFSTSEENVLEAVQFGLLQGLIADLPEGLQTVLIPNGVSLSGGQRQRVALARARIRDTPILILDESTSALDGINRTLMIEAIRRWRKGRTTIIISHDISQILADDYVCVLKNGCLVQEGRRRQLETLENTPFQEFLQDRKAETGSPPDTASGILEICPPYENDKLENSCSPCYGYDLPQAAQVDVPDYAEISQISNGIFFQPFDSSFCQNSNLHQLPPSHSRCPGLQPGSRTMFKVTDHPSSSQSKKMSISSKITTNSYSGETEQLQDLIEMVSRAGRYVIQTRLESGHPSKSPCKAGNHSTILQGTGQHHWPALLSLSSHASSETSLGYILGTVWPNLDIRKRLLLLLVVWAATIHAAFTPCFAYLLSEVFGTYSVPGGDTHQALVYSMIILAMAFVDALHVYLLLAILENIAQHWTDRLRTEAYKRILWQPRCFFDEDANRRTHLTETLDRYGEEMRNLVGRFAGMIYVAVVMTFITFTWSMIAQWKMTLVAIALVPYALLTTKLYAIVSSKWENGSNNASEAVSVVFTEVFLNIKTVRALTLESHFRSKYETAAREALKKARRRALFVGTFFGLSNSIEYSASAILCYVGAKLVTWGVPATNIIQVFTMLLAVLTALASLLSFIPQAEASKDAATRFIRLACLPTEHHEDRGNLRIIAVNRIEFKDVKFSYPSRPALSVLRSLNLRLNAETSTAIVGMSGSGKSTIANLLLKLYETSSGSVLVNGTSIDDIDTRVLRSLVICVPQTPILFAASIADNITYGLSVESPCITSKNITHAAQQAGVHEFISSLPLGYATMVGEGGIGLSGGQTQRIAIARALIRKPAVLILDEITSALDVVSARLVRQTIVNLLDRTVSSSAHTSPFLDTQNPQTQRSGLRITGRPIIIIITHDQELMAIAERVVVLEDGNVVEDGTWANLTAKKSGTLVNILSGVEWRV